MKHTRPSFATIAALSVFLSGASAFFAGCGSDDETGTTSSSTSTSTGTGGGGGAEGGGTPTGGTGGTGGTINPGDGRMTITGDATWDVTFDATAQSNGATNCSYTRHYEGVQDQSAPWLCPSCDVMFRATVQMTAGQQDCFVQVSDTPPAPEEWVGYGGGNWWRGRGGPMSEQGTATVTATTVDIANSVQDLEAMVGGTLGFDITGAFALGEELGDPMHGWVAENSYTCSWPKAAPPEYTGNYLLTVGQPLPDGLFRDRCDEVVRLHDFKGAYLVIDMSAIDCPPCQNMASQEAQFETDMAAQSIEVHVITMLAPALADPLGLTTTAMLENWTTTYGLTSPVLADRGWGLSMFLPALVDETAYPSWVIVDPDLLVVEMGVGFGGFAELETAILADING
jgi:hypothetical protein